MKRRHFILGTSAIAVSSALVLKPKNNGAPYSPYFQRLNDALSLNGPYKPVLLVDLNRLDKNLETLKSTISKNINYRIVAKSLPSPELLDYVMSAMSTNRLMLFHLPFLQYVANNFHDSDVLLGKPMPVRAVELFYQKHVVDNGFEPSEQLQWLIDTPERLHQYQLLAKKLGVNMRINVEIDVGLHRGGLSETEELTGMLRTIQSDSKHLTFSGLMGYDPHVVKLPSLLKSEASAFGESQEIYRKFIEVIVEEFPSIDVGRLCLNGAGSPTLALHQNGSVINDISAGSCLVKPKDFDIPSLTNFIPAAYIATPVLKKMPGVRLPSVESLSALFEWWDPNQAQTYFIYGGQWMADYESPVGLQANGLYGISTNQQIVNGAANLNIGVDDHVFLRPRQSEAVFLQFGRILTIRNETLDAEWSILQDA